LDFTVSKDGPKQGGTLATDVTILASGLRVVMQQYNAMALRADTLATLLHGDQTRLTGGANEAAGVVQRR